MRTIAVDLLHTFYLGPLLFFCRDVIWLFLDQNVHARTEGTSHERLLTSLAVLKSQLWAWYAAYDRSHRDKPLTRLADLTPKMVGIGGAPDA